MQSPPAFDKDLYIAFGSQSLRWPPPGLSQKHHIKGVVLGACASVCCLVCAPRFTASAYKVTKQSGGKMSFSTAHILPFRFWPSPTVCTSLCIVQKLRRNPRGTVRRRSASFAGLDALVE